MESSPPQETSKFSRPMRILAVVSVVFGLAIVCGMVFQGSTRPNLVVEIGSVTESDLGWSASGKIINQGKSEVILLGDAGSVKGYVEFYPGNDSYSFDGIDVRLGAGGTGAFQVQSGPRVGENVQFRVWTVKTLEPSFPSFWKFMGNALPWEIAKAWCVSKGTPDLELVATDWTTLEQREVGATIPISKVAS